jgi:hypothetical protein
MIKTKCIFDSLIVYYTPSVKKAREARRAARKLDDHATIAPLPLLPSPTIAANMQHTHNNGVRNSPSPLPSSNIVGGGRNNNPRLFVRAVTTASPTSSDAIRAAAAAASVAATAAMMAQQSQQLNEAATSAPLAVTSIRECGHGNGRVDLPISRRPSHTKTTSVVIPA